MGTKNKLIVNVRDLNVKMGDYYFLEEFVLFELGGVDVILGMTWLAALEESKFNWKTLAMTFSHHDQRFTMKGDLNLCKHIILS